MAEGSIARLIEMDRTAPKRIVVIGDGMVDVYKRGHLDSCQEGCRKFVEESQAIVAGGAANARGSLVHWCAEKVLISSHRLTPIKTRFMVEGECVFRHDDDGTFVFDLDCKETMQSLKSWCPDAVLISDYNKGTLATELIRRVIDYCISASIPVVADVKREPKVYQGAIIKCNAAYARQHGRPLAGEWGIVTDGARPPTVYRNDVDRDHLLISTIVTPQLPDVECVNHVGAGDCFAAHLTLALAYGLPMLDAAAIAHSAGRVYVQHEHNRPPLPAEIEEDMGRAAKSPRFA